MRALKGVDGPQGCGKASKWVSDCLRWGNEGLKKYYKGLIKGGKILKCCEVFNGRGETKREEKRKSMEKYPCMSVP